MVGLDGRGIEIEVLTSSARDRKLLRILNRTFGGQHSVTHSVFAEAGRGVEDQRVRLERQVNHHEGRSPLVSLGRHENSS